MSKPDSIPARRASTIDLRRHLFDPVGQDALDVLLPKPEHVVVACGEVTDIHWIHRKTSGLNLLSLGEEAISDPALVEDLDRS